MLVKTGLLILSNPTHLGKILTSVQQRVKNVLYIQLLSALNESLSFHPNVFTSCPKYSQTIWGIYSQAAQYCNGLDVRVLLSGLKYKNLSKIQTQNKIELVIFDRKHGDQEINNFLQAKIENISQECDVLTLNAELPNDIICNNVGNDKTYQHTVLGGTFDRLHIAHKILLSEAALRSSSKVTVGVTDETMLQGKILWELIEPLDQRLDGVTNFLNDVCPELSVSVVPIDDIFGPTKDDPSMDMLVVSAETLKGGHKINEVRQSKNLPILDIVSVEVIGDPHHDSVEEEKISSSTSRMRILGTIIKPVKVNELMANKPYIIGLTGGIASGKSAIAQKLQELGAHVIDCDKLAHELYQPGKPCHTLIVKTFGKSVLTENNEIDRKVLGSIVFKNPDELVKLNGILWPIMKEEICDRIKKLNCDVVVIEAAVLLAANWENCCHEVWVTIIPQNEAISRLQIRNGLNKEQAENRIASQYSNSTYVEAANVVFCSLWAVEYTHRQVERAWYELQGRLL